jgi:hypothetical protein
MSDLELMRVELLIWKAIAASRERQNIFLEKSFDTVLDIANFWRDRVQGDADYTPEIRAKLAALEALK